MDEADIGRIKEHQKVNFTVDSYPQRKFSGVVTQVRKAATVTNNVVTYKVIISLENKDLLLLPGMTANVDIVFAQRDNVLRVSNSALRFSPEGGSSSVDSQEPDMAQRVAQLSEQLDLNASQQRQLKEVLTDMQKAMQVLRESAPAMAGGPPARKDQGFKKYAVKCK